MVLFNPWKKTISICSSTTLFSLPGLLSHCRTRLTPNNTEYTPRSPWALWKLCCLNDLQTFGSFVGTIKSQLDECNATLWLQLEMKRQDDAVEANDKDHDATTW